MNVISGVMSVFLAGLSVSIEAQLTLGSTKPLNTPVVFKGMEGIADFPVPGKEAYSKPPSIEIGDISLRNGIKARNIRLYGSSDPHDLSTPLPGLDQALAGCDGNQANGWVSYDAVTISCSQGGVETERTLPLPPSTQKALSLVMETRGKGSKMLIAKNPQKARLVVDDSMLTATSKILTTMQFGSPFANTTYAVGDVREFKDNDGKNRLFVDLCVIDEEDLNQPATDGNSFSRKKGGSRFPFKCGSSKNQNSDSEDGEFPEEGGGSQMPGGNGGDERDPSKNNTNKEEPESVMIFSTDIDPKKLGQAIQDLVNSATNEQLKILNSIIILLIDILYHGEEEKEEQDPEHPELLVDILRRSEPLLQNSDDQSATSRVRKIFCEMVKMLSSGMAAGDAIKSLNGQQYQDQLKEIQNQLEKNSDESDASQKDGEAPSEAGAASAESSTRDSVNVTRLIANMLSVFLEIEIKTKAPEPENPEEPVKA